MKKAMIEREKSAAYTPKLKREHEVCIYAGREYTEWRLPNGTVEVEHHRRETRKPERDDEDNRD